MHPFLKLFDERIVYLDGAMGTALQAMGLTGGQPPERWNRTYPQRVKSVYACYLRAGADMVTANTFGANPLHYPDEWETLLRLGIRQAKEAVAESGRTAYVALEAGSVGKLLRPLGELDFEDAVRIYRDMALAAIDEGCDVLVAETMTDLGEVKAAVLGYREALLETGADKPVLVSLSYDVKGRLLTGADIEGATACCAPWRAWTRWASTAGASPRRCCPT
jgi:5-methyltetrahydrofolate--homocysteine methyltransferase